MNNVERRVERRLRVNIKTFRYKRNFYTKLPNCAPHLVDNPPTLNIPLPEGQQRLSPLWSYPVRFLTRASTLCPLPKEGIPSVCRHRSPRIRVTLKCENRFLWSLRMNLVSTHCTLQGLKMFVTPSPPPERIQRKHHFGLRAPSPSPSPEQKHHFGLRAPSPSPSPEQKYDFGIRTMPSPSPEPELSIGMHATPPPPTERKSDFGIRKFGASREPLFLPDPEDDDEPPAPLSREPQGLGIRAPLPYEDPAGSNRGVAARAVSPLPQAEDFGVRLLDAPKEGPSQIGTHQPTEAIEPFSSSPGARRKFHIASSYTYLTMFKQVGYGGSQRHLLEIASRKVSPAKLEKSSARMSRFVKPFARRFSC